MKREAISPLNSNNVIMVTVSPHDEGTGLITFHTRTKSNPNHIDNVCLHVNNFQILRLLDEVTRYCKDYMDDKDAE